ncbi:Ankyrin repeats (3 copies) [compost metagenome]
MKFLAVFLFLWGSIAFSAEDLNFQLTQAADRDDLQEAVRLLDLGADPLKDSFGNGWRVSPAMHVAAFKTMKTGKDQVYKEFLRRGIPANALAKSNGQSVWNYIFIWQDEKSTSDKLEAFFLRSLSEGANPFPAGVDSGQLHNLIFLGLDRVVAEIINKGISKTSWLLFTNSWTHKCHAISSASLHKTCLESFKKYFPVLQQYDIQAKDWGYYKYDGLGNATFQGPVVMSLVNGVGMHVQADLIEEFIRHGYDINYRFEGESACDIAKVPDISDVNTMLKFGCQWTNLWTARALARNDLKYAQTLLSMGHGVDEMFATKYDTHTLMTYFCLYNQPEYYPILQWLLQKGANPNSVSARKISCIHEIARTFYYDIKNQSGLKTLKLLISYKADLNLMVSNSTPLRTMSYAVILGATTKQEKDYVVTMGIETLLKAGANPNLVPPNEGKDLDLPLLLLGYYGMTPVGLKAINILMNYKADPRVLSDKTASITHLLSSRCNFQGCAEALQKSIKLAPDLLNQKGNYYYDANTPLCLAVDTDNALTAEVLLKNKADHKILCEPSGKTPYQTARTNSKVRKILEKFGVTE